MLYLYIDDRVIDTLAYISSIIYIMLVIFIDNIDDTDC